MGLGTVMRGGGTWLLAGAVCFTTAACNQERETSEVSTIPDNREASAEDPVVLEDPVTDTCCERYCEALADAGCATADCVAEHCPVPDTLLGLDATKCKNARADVLCCAWRYAAPMGCTIGDARSAPECSNEVSAADQLCAAQ
jgi:hypothetical protein